VKLLGIHKTKLTKTDIMKKILFTLLSLSLITSCSSDDSDNSNENPINENITSVNSNLSELKSYTITFPSENFITHNFDGSNGINSLRNEVLQSSFEYDTDGNLHEYIFYQSDGTTIDYSYTFNYNETNNIESIDVFESFSFTKPENYTMSFEYDGNTITTGIPENSNGSSFNQIELTFNDDGTISRILEKESDFIENGQLIQEGELQFLEEFNYDNNKNCTSASRSENSPFTGELVESTFEYRYDNEINPLYNFYQKNYIPIIIIYSDRFNAFGVRGIQQAIEQFAQNTHNETIFPSGFPDSIKFTYENEYDSDSNLTTNTVRNVDSGEITASTIFEY